MEIKNKSRWWTVFAVLAVFAFRAHALGDHGALSFNEGLQIMEEDQTLAGQTVDQQLSTMNRWFEGLYGYDLRCEDGWFSQLSSVRCLMGMRAFAKAAYEDRIPKYPVTSDHALIVTISKAHVYTRVRWAGAQPNLSVPFDATPEQIGTFIRGELGSEGFARPMQLLTVIDSMKNQFTKKTGMDVAFDLAVDLDQWYRGVYLLSLLAENEPRVFKDLADVEAIEISNYNRGPYDKHLEFTDGIDASASYENLRSYFLNADRRRSSSRIQRLKQVRIDIEVLKRIVARELGVNHVYCSRLKDLTMDQCQQALERLAKTPKEAGPYRVPADVLVIATEEEVGDQWDYYLDAQSGSQMMLLAEDFSASDFVDFVKKQGWLELSKNQGALR